MHSIYKIAQISDSKWQFERKEEVALFGSKKGIICQMLKEHLTTEANEPFEWCLNIRESLKHIELDKSALIINFKPNSAGGNLSLYELVKVWGYSDNGWTPILLYFRGLLVDKTIKEWNENKFTRDLSEVKEDDPIFSFTYRNGTICNGELCGKWTSSGPSSANSVLLWPKAYQYFIKEAAQVSTALQ